MSAIFSVCKYVKGLYTELHAINQNGAYLHAYIHLGTTVLLRPHSFLWEHIKAEVHANLGEILRSLRRATVWCTATSF